MPLVDELKPQCLSWSECTMLAPFPRDRKVGQVDFNIDDLPIAPNRAILNNSRDVCP